MSYAFNPHQGVAYYDGGTTPPLMVGPAILTQGWYWSAQAYRLVNHHLRRVWAKRTARDSGNCWVPLGPSGAALLQETPNVGPSRLGLFDLSSGYSYWRSRTTEVGDAVSAGDQIVLEEDPTGSIPGRESVLAVRDARTGRIQWRSRSFVGQPVAASRGQVFIVSSKGKLLCLQ